MTVHIAIFALLSIYDEAVEALNIVARAFARDGQAERFQPAFFQHFVGQSFADRPATVLVTHSMAFTVVLLALVSREFIQTRRKRQENAPQ